MPITINGSGTVTGISVGGLPDGIVDTDTLAAGAGGVNEVDVWRQTADFTGDKVPITTGWERNDSYGFSKLGTGMTESSGVFSFPSTGFWHIQAVFGFQIAAGTDSTYCNPCIDTTIDNGSTWNFAAEGNSSLADEERYTVAPVDYIFDVTNTTNCKVRFDVWAGDGSLITRGDTNKNETWVNFIRLGDT